MAGPPRGGGESRRYRALGPGEQRRDLHFRAAGMRLQRPAAAPAGSQPDRPARGDPGDPAAAAPWRRGAPGERHLGPRLGRHSLPGRLLRRAVRQGGSERRPAPRAGAHGHQVSVVSPGRSGRRSGARSPARASAPGRRPDAVADLYRDTYLRFLQANEDGARNSATKPADVAAAVHAALTAAKPRTRYRVGADVRRGTCWRGCCPIA